VTIFVRAALPVNQELNSAILGIGREILERQAREGWGSRVIDRLSADLRRAFPDMTGLSARNLKYMRARAEAHSDPAFVQEVVARLSGFWRASRTLRVANGTHGRRSNMVGAASG
jgi:DUF1016 N-terminal domain